VRLLTSAVAVALQWAGAYGDGDLSLRSGYFYLMVLNNVAFTVALYCLVVFYYATVGEIKAYHPLLKFLTIKIVVFFSFWQSVVIAILVAAGVIHGFWIYTPAQAGIILANTLVCIEMLFVSVLDYKAYPVDLYRITTASSHPLVQSTQKPASFLQNVKHVTSQGDTLHDTMDAFAPPAQQQSVALHSLPSGFHKTPDDFSTGADDDTLNLEEDEVVDVKQVAARR